MQRPPLLTALGAVALLTACLAGPGLSRETQKPKELYGFSKCLVAGSLKMYRNLEPALLITSPARGKSTSPDIRVGDVVGIQIVWLPNGKIKVRPDGMFEVAGDPGSEVGFTITGADVVCYLDQAHFKAQKRGRIWVYGMVTIGDGRKYRWHFDSDIVVR